MTSYPSKTSRRWQNSYRFIYKWMKISGIGSLVTGWLMFMWTFLVAHSRPEKNVLVAINNYGEGQIEFYVVILLLVPTIYVVSRIIKHEAQVEASR